MGPLKFSCYPPRPVWPILLVITLLTCRPPADEVPKGASLQLVMAQNRPPKPVYFWEDSLQRQVSFELYYFNQNQQFTSPPEKPQFLVNNQPIIGNTFTFPGPGQYVFSARVKNRTSDNELVITVSKAADYLQAVVIKAPVLLLNADSISQLPLTYELIPKLGKPHNVTHYPSPELRVDDQPQTQAAFFSTHKAGLHQLQATFLGVPSNALIVTARPTPTYPLVRLPVVFHVPKGLAPELNPARLLASLNPFFRKELPGMDPNRADAAIEFYPASTNAQGQPMATAGLNSLSVSDPASISEAQHIVADLLHTWCPRQYINVIIGLNWIDSYEPTTNYAFIPVSPPANTPQPTCTELALMNWPSAQFPAIHLAPSSWVIDNGTLAHELGHFLGLPHSFLPACEASNVLRDVPVYLQNRADQSGLKYTCQGAAFVSDNIMDYNVNWRSFTQDQVSTMRLTLQRGRYIPTSSAAGGPRNEHFQTQNLNQGSITP